jgi:hypothetical protein
LGKTDLLILPQKKKRAKRVELDPNWKFVADDVMGGKSNGGMSLEMFQGRNAAVLRGDVSLDSNGGFIQIALDLLADGAGFDASNWDGIELDVWGNGERYDIRLSDVSTRGTDLRIS